jgi:hypothetical protein
MTKFRSGYAASGNSSFRDQKGDCPSTRKAFPKPTRAISARAALAELKQAAELIPNQAVLINTLPLLEYVETGDTSI